MLLIWNITFIRIVHEKLIEELMLQRHALHWRVGYDVVMSHIIQTRYCIQTAAWFLITEECYCFSLGTLELFVLIIIFLQYFIIYICIITINLYYLNLFLYISYKFIWLQQKSIVFNYKTFLLHIHILFEFISSIIIIYKQSLFI